MSGACAVRSVPSPPVKLSDTSQLTGAVLTTTGIVTPTALGAVAVSVVVPTATPVMLAVAPPVLTTVAIDGSPVVHVYVMPTTGVLPASVADAVAVWTPATRTAIEFGVTVTCATTGGGVTVTGIVACTVLGAVAVSVVVPAA